MTAAHRVELVAVVVDGQHVLVVEHRDSGHCELPSGSLRDGEDVLTGLRRCVGLATGLVVAVDRLSGVYTREGSGMSLVFLARHVTGRSAARGDVELCRWVTPDVAFRML